LPNTAVAIFRVNVTGAAGSLHIDQAVGGKWDMKDVIGRTEDQEGSHS
jgi:hypothetical protein